MKIPPLHYRAGLINFNERHKKFSGPQVNQDLESSISKFQNLSSQGQVSKYLDSFNNLHGLHSNFFDPFLPKPYNSQVISSPHNICEVKFLTCNPQSSSNLVCSPINNREEVSLLTFSFHSCNNLVCCSPSHNSCKVKFLNCGLKISSKFMCSPHNNT